MIVLAFLHKTLSEVDLEHCVKSVRIRSYSGPHIPAFGLNTETEYGETLRISLYSVQMRENADQNNCEYGHFSRIGIYSNTYNGAFLQKLLTAFNRYLFSEKKQ